MNPSQDHTAPNRGLLRSARVQFGRERLRAAIRRPLSGYTFTRRAAAVRALRTEGIDVGIDRVSSLAVINLKARADRLASFTEETERLGIEGVQRFDAVEDSIGAIGCTRSHASLIREMIEGRQPSLMVFEDDVRFRASRDKIDVLVDAFLDDEHAEVACLEFNAQKTRRYNSLFLRATESQNAGCYLVKSSIAEELLDAFEDGVEAMSKGGDPLRYNVDIVWKRLQKTHVFVVPIERVAYQEPGYSDIERRFVRRSV